MTTKPQLIPATLDDYPAIQNMARFYVYEMSRECGLNSADWACPADGLYESFDFKHYFIDPNRRAYLVKVDGELAGFALLYQTGEQPNMLWHIGEFFILARFQNRGIGRTVTQQVWQQHPGAWEVTVIPENQRALQFWRKAITATVNHNFLEDLKPKEGRIDPDQPNRIFLTFNITNTTDPND
ncbi:MAG: GNAT family N-acetyltransferase [Legionellaceae bacterium]|nr:GNAT family N-acetyltransferase [Legionellaceae bacterium]